MGLEALHLTFISGLLLLNAALETHCFQGLLSFAKNPRRSRGVRLKARP